MIRLLVTGILLQIPLAAHAQEKDKAPYRLFAMDTGLRGPDMKSVEDRVLLLKKLGYAGIGYTFNAKELPRLLELLDKHGLELSALYTSPALDDKLDEDLRKSL